MQNKGAIITFAIALTLVSLYQLSFTWVSNSVKSDAEQYAQQFVETAKQDTAKFTEETKAAYLDSIFRRKRNRYLDSISGVEVYNLGVRKYTFQETQERELNLGLDLKGGMNVILEVSVVELIQNMAGNRASDSLFVKTIRTAKDYQHDSQEDFVTLFGQAFQDVAGEQARLAEFFYGNPDLKDRNITYNSTNEEVLNMLRGETNAAIDNSFNILRSRIDRFGVAQPNIQRLERQGRILVELPGVKDPERVRNLLQGTANLEFWETYMNPEVFPFLRDANTKLKEILDAERIEELPLDTTLTEKTDTLESEEEAVVPADTTEQDTTLVDETDDSDTSKSLMEQLEDTTSLEEQVSDDTSALTQDEQMAQFQENNPLFAVLNPNTNREGNLIQTASIGITHKKDTALVNKYLRMPQIRNIFPRDLHFAWTVKAFDEAENFFQLIALKASEPRTGAPALSGDVITNARAEFGQNQANAEVTMSMNSEGAKKWARITKEAASQQPKRQIAIVLDGFVYSFPTVQNEISGGRSSITGDFSIQEAQDLANILKSGKMPARAHIIEEEIVGPSLGQEAINSGLVSFLIAFIVVMLYMIFYYKTGGMVADIALITNIFFIFGVLASLGAVLTLPGIAGIVLTIGMSVDANVLIYDRIREEMKLGKGMKLAVSDGYKNAYSAIVDANVTTLLTGVILYVFGHGPIKGFATTLVIGILTSLFSAIFITRLIFLYFLNRNKTISFATRLTENAFDNTNVQFLQKRKIAYVISGIIIVLGITSLAVRGLNQGVDFTGGRNYVVRFDQDVNTVEIANSLEGQFNQEPEVKTFGGNHQVKITTKFMIENEDPNVDSIVETRLFQGVKDFYQTDISFDDFSKEFEGKDIGKMSSQKVGPSIADDIKVSAVYSVIFALIIIFLYIFIRFKNWQYGLGALAALVHDTLIVIGLFSLLYGVLPFSLEIDQAFIAAILTVVGYSINDTVVVFDRIREFLGLHKKEEKGVVYNSALNSTLSRTFSTSLSTFFVLLTIFLFGGEVIRGFIFALLIGVIVGTYSSLFIATPVVYDTIRRKELKQKEKQPANKRKKRKAKKKK